MGKTIIGKTVSLMGGRRNKYCADEGNRVVCNRNRALQWEKFTIVSASRRRGRVALKGGRHGKYCADDRHGRMKCNRGHVKGWEKYQIRNMGGGKYAFKGGRGNRWCADHHQRRVRKRHCRRKCIRFWRRSRCWNHCWHAWHGHNWEGIKCDRGHILGWEKFKIQCRGNCDPGAKAYNRKVHEGVRIKRKIAAEAARYKMDRPTLDRIKSSITSTKQTIKKWKKAYKERTAKLTERLAHMKEKNEKTEVGGGSKQGAGAQDHRKDEEKRGQIGT